VDKKINLGSNVTKSTTGPTIAASLELEKNTATKKEREISDMENKKKKRKTKALLEERRKDDVVISVALSAIQKKSTNAVRNQES